MIPDNQEIMTVQIEFYIFKIKLNLVHNIDYSGIVKKEY